MFFRINIKMPQKRHIVASFILIIISIGVLVVQHFFKDSNEVKIHPEINKMLGYLQLDNCKITELNGINEVKKISIATEEVSKSEIESYISNQLEMKSTFQADPSLKQVSDNDCVKFSIIKYEGNEEIFSSNEEYLCINKNDSSVISQSLIGRLKGEVIETIENIDGHNYRYIITLKEIGKIILPEFDDDFVNQYFNETSVSEYIEELEQSLKNEHKNVAILKAQNDVLQEFIDKCKFDLDKQQVTNYSLTIVNSYVDEAYLFNKDLETYYTENLNMSEKEFFDHCYQKGEEYIKRMLVVGAIAESANYSINETEMLASSSLKNKHLNDEAYTYMEYHYLTQVVTKPYIIS